MSGIPIVVSRLTNSGKKEVYTVRDPLNNHDDYVRQIAQSPPPDFFTMDFHKEKENKVRIRRIQSSGSRRNFPKDFFSREGQRPNRNNTLKEKQENENVEAELNTFVNRTNELEFEQPKINNETPKFREKIPTSKVSLLSKNQTFRQAFKKIIPPKENQIKEEKKVDKRLNPFENTFSGNNLIGTFWKDQNLTLKSSKTEKENLPTKKIKVTKEFLTKKFSYMKDKINFSKQKKLKI